MDTIFSWMGPGFAFAVSLAPLLTPVVGGIAAWVAISTFRRRSRIDSSDEWWKRAQFALESSVSENLDAQLMGTALLTSLRVELNKPTVTDGSRLKNFNIMRKWKKELKERNPWNVQEKDLIMLSAVLEATDFSNGSSGETVDNEDDTVPVEGGA